MRRLAVHCALVLGWLLATLVVGSLYSRADETPNSGYQGHRTYQRKAFERSWRKDGNRRGHHRGNFKSPEISSGWFQRPYPYHLDYYRMRYHGSYEPYFGNLYGPPQVVTAPPYYGPYYGGYGEPGAYAEPGAYGQELPEGVIKGPVVERSVPSGTPTTVPGNEPLPSL